MQPANVVTVRMVNGLQPNQPTIGHRNCTPLSSMLFPSNLHVLGDFAGHVDTFSRD